MKKPVIIIACLVLAVGLIGGALYVRQNNLDNQSAGTSDADKITPPPTESAEPQDNTDSADGDDTASKAFTTTELAEFDGKDGNECYVAVDGTVYKIEQGNLWNNGQHDTSNGQASCGRDLSDVIGQSPHGKSKLSTLEVVGTLQD